MQPTVADKVPETPYKLMFPIWKPSQKYFHSFYIFIFVDCDATTVCHTTLYGVPVILSSPCTQTE